MVLANNPKMVLNTELKTKVRAQELLSTFERCALQVKVLSLDCFDTLLWRRTDAPRDVFYDLENKPTFKALDFSALTRINAESFAYNTNKLHSGTRQTKLDKIYRSAFPQLTIDETTALSAEELEAEIEACYAFPPVVELIRKAKSYGIKIIIVSDTYLDVAQLTRLLASKLPVDVMAAIDKIYCSSDMNKGKAEGLFKDIIPQLRVPPASILHIGDNLISDYASPRLHGVNTLQLIQHEEVIAEVLRMQAVAASYIDPSVRNTRALMSPFKSLFSEKITTNAPETIIGYAAVGPIMYAFAHFIRDEVARLKQAGKRPKVLFLMRDAHLPALACEELCGEAIGKRVRISRFASYASSFRDQNDVDSYLTNRIKSGRFADICNQLLLPDTIKNRILEKIKNSKQPDQEFLRLIHKADVLQTIYAQSAIYRQRLIRHLQKEVAMQAGDTLVFVDLGYSGTAQNRLAPVFQDEAQVDISGCYLIALRTPNWQATRRGLIDPSAYDDKTLGMLTAHIALFEQLCTSTEKSVIDYAENGDPIYSDITVGEQQHSKLKPIHAECVRFIKEAKTNWLPLQMQLPMHALRDAAAFNLCRLTFLPTKTEVDYLQAFHMDFNVGTKEVLPIFDLEKGMTSLKRRSWLYSAREHLMNTRLNYPVEWRSTNLELVLTLMGQLRFGFEVAPMDLTQRSQSIRVVTVHNNQVLTLDLDATLTFDGYYSLMIPVVNGNYKAGIQFGLKYKWIEIESAELIEHKAIYSNVESNHTQDAEVYLSGEDIADKSGGLYECLSEKSLIIFTRAADLKEDNYVLRVIFRPIVMR